MHKGGSNYIKLNVKMIFVKVIKILSDVLGNHSLRVIEQIIGDFVHKVLQQISVGIRVRESVTVSVYRCLSTVWLIQRNHSVCFYIYGHTSLLHNIF